MQSFLREAFINPAMLWGMLVVAVPILIYLISRQRYERRPWAAMEFLLRAIRRHRRKIQLQNLLLLLVRIAILALLVIALARPVQRKGKVVVAPERSRNWILAVDLSYSMGYQEDGRSALDRARDAIGKLVGPVIEPGDQVAALTFEKHPRVVLPPTHFGGEGAEKLSREIADLELTSSSLDLGVCLSALDELCGKFLSQSGVPESKRVIIFSDFQKKDWLDSEGQPRAGLPQFLEKIQNEGGEFSFADFRPRQPFLNVAVVEFTASPTLIAKDVWMEFRATIRNFSDQDVGDLDVTIYVDRDPEDASFEPQLGGVVRIPARGSVTRVLPYRFASAGVHTAVAEVRSDGLLIDNRRYLSVRVFEDVRVLLVDGDPATRPIDRETVHVEVALAPEPWAEGGPTGRFTPYRTEYVTVDQLQGLDLSQFALVVLANVADLPADETEALRSYVRSGGAAMVFLGRNVRADFYNREFGADGFLPGTLGEIRGDLRYPVYLEPVDPSHPVVRYFEEHRETTHIHRPVIAFGKYMEVAGPGGESSSARVAFRFSDAARNPAIFDNGYGAGRVLWVTSTADQEWNEFSSWPDFVVFLHEAVSYLVSFGLSSANLLVGETFRRTYPASEYASEVILRIPEPLAGDLRKSRNVQKALRPLSGAVEFELLHEETDVPGLYRIEFVRSGVAGSNNLEYFAVNVDPSESDLRPMSDEDFRTTFENLRYETFDASERVRRVQSSREAIRGREFWRWFVFLALAIAAGETALAFLVGRRPTK